MRDETKMDANRLITEVHKRPALWNQRHISYHNRDVTNRIWMEIAALFNLPKQVLKTKWKGLRDTFRAEIKKEQVYRKTKYTHNRPVWIHFKTLQFLKEQMVPRPPIWERSNNSRDNNATSAGTRENNCSRIVRDRRVTPVNIIASTTIKDNPRASKRTCSHWQRLGTRHDSLAVTHDDDDVLGAGEADANADSVKEDLSSSAINSPNQPHSDSHFSRDNNNSNNNNNNNHDEDASEVKQEPVDRYEEEFENVAEEINNLDDNGSMLESISPEDEVLMADTAGENSVIAGQLPVDPLEGNRLFDDNYYFLMSLLPHIRTLPAERRMLLRMQMQQLVYQEVYNRSRSSLSPVVSPARLQDQRP